MTCVKVILNAFLLITFSPHTICQKNVYDLDIKLEAMNTFFVSENIPFNDFTKTESDRSYRFGINNTINIAKESAISLGCNFARIGFHRSSKISFLSFPITVRKYFNEQRDKLNLALTINPGMDLEDDNNRKLYLGYHMGYKFRKSINLGLAFEMDSESDRVRLFHLGLFIEYTLF